MYTVLENLGPHSKTVLLLSKVPSWSIIYIR